jgi:hypothetical protein
MFTSKFIRLGTVMLPEFSGLRIMMMPLVIGQKSSLPDYLDPWHSAIDHLWMWSFYQFGTDRDYGKVGYLTIDEKIVQPGQTHRRPGLHVDGIYQGKAGAWGGGGGGGWSGRESGAITVSSHIGCRAWMGDFDGWPGLEGECDHLVSQCHPENAVTFEAGVAYWFDGLCVHESIVQSQPVARQFVRLSLPSSAPWFEGYTKNPLGVLPSGAVLSRRDFMDQ